ncbi:DNA-binding protein [Mycobacterium sp. DSM 3803]|nr:DNA-binding protein [Mycobacterium sp. DSM 3803]
MTTTQAADRAPALVPIREARAHLGGIGATKLYDLIGKGELTKVNIGRRGFITARSLDEYVDRLGA